MMIHGDEMEAYRAAYPSPKKSDAVVKSAAGKLMRQPAIYLKLLEHQEVLKKNIQSVIIDKENDNTGEKLLTKDRKREILKSIAEGKLRLQKISFNKLSGEPKVVEKLPDHNDIMKAIELDSRLVGDLAPVKGYLEIPTLPSEFDNLSEAEIKDLLTKNQE